MRLHDPVDEQRFDLKGIPERYVDLHKSSNETLWDGDWVEGMQTTSANHHPYNVNDAD